jgi:hypothetical protein
MAASISPAATSAWGNRLAQEPSVKREQSKFTRGIEPAGVAVTKCFEPAPVNYRDSAEMAEEPDGLCEAAMRLRIRWGGIGWLVPLPRFAALAIMQMLALPAAPAGGRRSGPLSWGSASGDALRVPPAPLQKR